MLDTTTADRVNQEMTNRINAVLGQASDRWALGPVVQPPELPPPLPPVAPPVEPSSASVSATTQGSSTRLTTVLLVLLLLLLLLGIVCVVTLPGSTSTDDDAP